MITKQLHFFSSLLLCILLFSNAIQSQNPPSHYQPVFDQAEVLNNTEEQQLHRQLVDYEHKTSTQIVVYIINSLKGKTVERYTNETFNELGIGQKNKDNGVLLLIAIEDRKLRIETGYGIEEYLTDTEADGIIRQYIRPEFKNQNYIEGIKAGINQIIGELEDAALTNSDHKKTKSPAATLFFIGFLCLILHLIAGYYIFVHKLDIPNVLFAMLGIHLLLLVIISTTFLYDSKTEVFTMVKVLGILSLIIIYLESFALPYRFFQVQALFWMIFLFVGMAYYITDVFTSIFFEISEYASIIGYLSGAQHSEAEWGIVNTILLVIFSLTQIGVFIYAARTINWDTFFSNSGGGSYNYSNSGSSYNSSSGGNYGGGSSSTGGGSSYSDYSDSSFGGGSSGGGGASGSW